jgi:hypothetical protein
VPYSSLLSLLSFDSFFVPLRAVISVFVLITFHGQAVVVCGDSMVCKLF